jgi:lysophospholipid acyltransferase (LPLAT)-like uncharacterized protein
LKQWWRDRRPYVLSAAIYAVARFIGITLRLKVVGYDAVHDLSCGKIYCGWHGRSIIPANFFKGKGVWAIISLSRDGEMQTRVFGKFGFNVIRGSTGRGGARALVESLRVLRRGEEMAITPDGPRGPSGVVQDGVMFMAQKSGAALVPVASYARPRWLAPTWDSYLVPWPFAKATFIFGEPIFVPAESTDEQVSVIKQNLQDEINRLQIEAEKAVSCAHNP